MARMKVLYHLRPDITAAELVADLKRDFHDPSQIPSVKTAGRELTRLRLAGGETWKPTDAEPEDAALVLPVLGHLIWATRGAIKSVTNREAKFIVKVRKMAPDLMTQSQDDGAISVFLLALDYEERDSQGRDTSDLDYFLAIGPWRGADKEMREFWRGQYQSLVDDGAIPKAKHGRFLDIADTSRRTHITDG